MMPQNMLTVTKVVQGRIGVCKPVEGMYAAEKKNCMALARKALPGFVPLHDGVRPEAGKNRPLAPNAAPPFEHLDI